MFTEEQWPEVLKSLQLVRIMYPDFDAYDAEMNRLFGMFKPGEGTDPAEYVESLYLIAKFASFSQAPASCSDEAWKLAHRKGERPSQPSGLQ